MFKKAIYVLMLSSFLQPLMYEDCALKDISRIQHRDSIDVHLNTATTRVVKYQMIYICT